MGPPIKLTKERSERIVAAVCAGATRDVAAQSAGIVRSTLQAWIVKGEAKDAAKLYAEFVEALREAEAAREVEALQNIRAAAAEDWRADAWYLERGPARNRYGRVDRHEISGADRGAIAVAGGWDLSNLTEEELATYQELTEKVQGDDA
jgi:predicted membrane metal-binding protein